MARVYPAKLVIKMKKPNFSSLAGLYAALMLLYACCWVVTLAGIAGSQSKCADKESQYVYLRGSGGMLAPMVGSDCSRLFRFPWTVLWLGIIPLIAEATILGFQDSGRMGRLTVGAGAPLWAVIAVLDILMANLFFNAVQANEDLASVTGFSDSAKERLQCTVAGFAMSAAVALMLLCIAPYCACAEGHDGAGSTTTAQSAKDTKGGVVPPSTGNPNVVVV